MDECSKQQKPNRSEVSMAALLGDVPEVSLTTITPSDELNNLVILSCDEVQPRPSQTRKRFNRIQELAKSIQEQGQLQPIRVTPPIDGIHYILQGERRWRACCMSPERKVLAIIDYRKTAVANNIAAQLVENIQREDLTVIETAQGILTLSKELENLNGKAPSHAELGRAISKSKAYVTKYLGVLGLPDDALKEAQSLCDNSLCNDVDALQNLRRIHQENPDAFFELCAKHTLEDEVLTRADTKKALADLNKPLDRVHEQNAGVGPQTKNEILHPANEHLPGKVPPTNEVVKTEYSHGGDDQLQNSLDDSDELGDVDASNTMANSEIPLSKVKKKQHVKQADWKQCKGSDLYIKVNAEVDEKFVTGYLMTDRICNDENFMYVATTGDDMNAIQIKVRVDSIAILACSPK